MEATTNTRTAPVAVTSALTLALAVGACASIKDEVARDKKVDQDLEAVTASGIPGASIVIRDGGSTSKVSLGLADVAAKTSIQVDDKVRIGSVAKTFVSVVVLQLAEEHKLSLDDRAFYRALLEGRLVEPASLKEMMTTVTQTNGMAYGLGLVRHELPCGTAWGHQGNFPGYYMETWSTADAHRQVTVAYNFDSTSMDKPQGEATTRLMNDAFCGVKP